MNFFHGAADHLRARNTFGCTKDVFRIVVAVNVRGDEIDRHVLRCGVRDEAIDPCSLSCGWAADAQARADALQRLRGFIIELVVRRFVRLASPKIEIRLVPDFEVPVRDFVDAVARDEMLGELADQIVPLGIVFRRRDDGAIPEGLVDVFGGELFGHEAQLDKRTHAIFQQAVVDLVDVREIVDGISGSVLVVDAEFVEENAVETDVLEIGDGFYGAEIVAIAFAHGEDGAARAEHLLPEVGKRSALGGGVDGVGFGGRGLLRIQTATRRDDGDAKNQRDERQSCGAQRRARFCEHRAVGHCVHFVQHLAMGSQLNRFTKGPLRL